MGSMTQHDPWGSAVGPRLLGDLGWGHGGQLIRLIHVTFLQFNKYIPFMFICGNLAIWCNIYLDLFDFCVFMFWQCLGEILKKWTGIVQAWCQWCGMHGACSIHGWTWEDGRPAAGSLRANLAVVLRTPQAVEHWNFQSEALGKRQGTKDGKRT